MALDRRVSSRVLGLIVLGACSIPGALAQAPTEANMIGVIVAAAILGFLLLVTLFFIAVYFIRQRDRREHRKERYRKQSGSTVANGTIATYPDYSTLHTGYYHPHPNLFYTTLPPPRLAGYRPKILASEMLVPAPYPYPYPYPYDQQSISGDEEAIPKERRSRSADPTARAYSDGHVANHVTTTSTTEYLTPVASGSDPKEVTRVDTHVTDTRPTESHEMHLMAPENYKVIRKPHKPAEKSEPRPLCELGATMDLGEEDPDAGSLHLHDGGPLGSEVTPSRARASVFQMPQGGHGSGNDDDYTIIDYLDDQIDASSSSPLPPPTTFASPLHDAELESGSPEERPELPRRCDDDDDKDDDDRDKEDGFAPASFSPPAEAEPVVSFSRPSPPPSPPPDADLSAPSPPPSPPAPPLAPPAPPPPAPEAAADVPGFGRKEPHTPPPHHRQNFHPPPPPPPDVPLDDGDDDDNDDEEWEEREGHVRFGDITQISEPSSPTGGKPEGDAPPRRPPPGPPGLPAALLSEIRQAGESKAASAAAGSPDY